MPLANRNGVPANQVFYTHWNREEVRDILSESLGKEVPEYTVFYTHWTREEVRDILSESLGKVVLFTVFSQSHDSRGG